MTRLTGILLTHLILSAGLATAAPESESPVRIENLRCEYLVDPLGIDSLEPRLSWTLHSERRGEVQSAYQVLVARTREALDRNVGDLWDTGKVKSPQMAQITYLGEGLRSRQSCYWKLRVWDRDGVPSAYSTTAHWEMGLMRPQEWIGKWIGTGRKVKPVCSLEGARVIQLANADTTTTRKPSPRNSKSTSGTLLTGFQKSVEIPGDRKPLTARLRFAAKSPVTVSWNEKELGVTAGKWAGLDVFDVMEHVTPGQHTISVVYPEGVTSPSLAGQLEVVFESGGVLRVFTDPSWQAGPLYIDKLKVRTWDDSKLTGTIEAGSYGDAKWPRSPEPDARVNAAPAPLFRRAFEVNGEVTRARVTVCGLGYHELTVNGNRVSNSRLDPAYTAFHKRALYVTHDVTTAVRTGNNALGVMLGSGWYDVHTLAEWNFDSAPWRNTPRLILDMHIELKDGRTLQFGSDDKWKWADGPVTFNSIYEGESYDARKEKPGWNTADYDDSKWNTTEFVEAPEGKLRAQMMPSIRAIQSIKPVKVSETTSGVQIYDLGQNIAGVPQLTIEGKAGTTLSLKCGERLLPDGTVDQKEIAVYTVGRDPRQHFQMDYYTLKQGLQTWEPRFTYHGFQYVEVAGATKPLTVDNLRGQVWHTDLKPTADFSCSNPLLNQIWDRTIWAYRGNLHGIPTDCPTREKNGWTGDAHLAAEVGLYAFDSPAFYSKWVNDLSDAQLENGDLPGIVPSGGWGYGIGIGPAWDSAYFLIPWHLYEYCGDKRILANHYAQMSRYVDYLTSRADQDGIVSYGLGDWVAYETLTSAALTSTGYYYRTP